MSDWVYCHSNSNVSTVNGECERDRQIEKEREREKEKKNLRTWTNSDVRVNKLIARCMHVCNGVISVTGLFSLFSRIMHFLLQSDISTQNEMAYINCLICDFQQ